MRFRLKNKGRFIVFLIVLVFMTTLLVSVVSVLAATPVQPDVAVVAVVSGDTLWDIASRFSHDGDIRDAVARIRQMNHLETSEIHPGQQLLVLR